jgi:hypothetical protein
MKMQREIDRHYEIINLFINKVKYQFKFVEQGAGDSE